MRLWRKGSGRGRTRLAIVCGLRVVRLALAMMSGIRVALGATRSHVLTQIMKQGLQVTAFGVTIGLAGALAVNRLIASLLFGVEPTDILTIAFVIATITAVAMVASWLPAWRASRLDPNVVLRDE